MNITLLENEVNSTVALLSLLATHITHFREQFTDGDTESTATVGILELIWTRQDALITALNAMAASNTNPTPTNTQP